MAVAPARAQFSWPELDHLTVGAFGGSPVPLSTVTALPARMPQLRLYDAYGLTETSCAASCSPTFRADNAVRAVQASRLGGPEGLEVVDVSPPQPGPGQILIDVDHAGANFGDTHQAAGTYMVGRQLPFVLGSEVVGRVSGTTRRVYAATDRGGYAEQVVADAHLVFDLADDIDDGTALALGLTGLTAWHLLRTSARLAPGESVVVHAAGGGVGTIALQLARAWGAGRIIATASTPEKRSLALRLGADVAVDPTVGGLLRTLRAANDGRLVDVVLEMAWGRVFDHSLLALAPFGRLVTYGSASGQQPRPIPPGELLARRTTGKLVLDTRH